MCNCYIKLLYGGSTTYLKLPFRIFCIRDAHDFVIGKLRKTLQVFYITSGFLLQEGVQFDPGLKARGRFLR